MCGSYRPPVDVDQNGHHRHRRKRCDGAKKFRLCQRFFLDERRKKEDQQLHGLHERIEEQVLLRRDRLRPKPCRIGKAGQGAQYEPILFEKRPKADKGEL